MAVSNNQPCQIPLKIIQTFHLVWLDKNIHENNQDCRSSITKLRQIVNTVTTFIDADECIDFITDTTEDAGFIVVSEQLGQLILPMVKDIPQIKAIYILNEKNLQLLEWTNKWKKIKGVYTDIESICEALRKDSKDWDRSTSSIGIVTATNENLGANKNTLHCSFMYTKMLKEILLTIKFDDEHFLDFLNYCRAQLIGNDQQLENLEKFQQEYRPDKSIWWYTSNNLFYSMPNRALRLMDIDIILKMGFFFCDLHNCITKLHSEQFGRRTSQSNPFIVYRGQALSQADFDQLKNNQGGLLSFNNFLSTSYDRQLSQAFAESNAIDPSNLGVLFIIFVDPAIPITSFANIGNIGNFNEEKEVLFSMHSIFRIGSIKELLGAVPIWEIQLTLTSDEDSQLRELTQTMQEEMNGSTGWSRLGKLLMELAQYSKAKELYGKLLKRTIDQHEKCCIFNSMGQINQQQGRYKDAISLYQKSLDIVQKTLPENHPSLASSYNNIGLVYSSTGEYSKALQYYEKSLDIQQKTLPANHPSLAVSYNNIGMVYNDMGEYSKALQYYEKSLDIRQKTLPANHPLLATSFNNIGLVYNDMGECSKALQYYEKSLDIRQKTLPANHPDLATFYSNIGLVYHGMGECSKALQYYEKSLDIQQKTLPANHPDLGTSYNNIGSVYYSTGQHSRTLGYFQRALDIWKRSLPHSHPSIKLAEENIKIVQRL